MSNLMCDMHELKHQRTAEKTPAQELGFKKGDLFQTTEISMAGEAGALVRLVKDDGTKLPDVYVIMGFFAGEDMSGSVMWVSIHKLEKLGVDNG